MNLTPEPRGFIPPADSGICRPIYGSGIIPPRVTIPESMKGEPITVFDDFVRDVAVDHVVTIVNEKLRLEDERMRRLLPDLPAGYSWRGEVEARDHVDFQSLEGRTSIRIVYRLYDPDGQRMTLRGRETWASDDER